ncbi:MerR family transcriptional regulator [Polaromonas sp.]|uniref:MerR family transcriptional regulator n=1 Tax=Polaromonas sp. TaxID=1869339 RepID=UPI003CC0DCEC
MSNKQIHEPSEWFTATQAARLAGLSRAMLNYLCREAVIEPSCNCARGHGIPRHYSFGDVVALRLVAKLSKIGISSLRLRKGLQHLKQYQPGISLSALPASHIVTDGQHIYLRGGADSLERATDGQYAFAFVIELDQIRREVIKKMTPTQLKVATG